MERRSHRALAKHKVKSGPEPAAEVVGKLVAEPKDDLKLTGNSVRHKFMAKPRDQVKAALSFAGKDPSAKAPRCRRLHQRQERFRVLDAGSHTCKSIDRKGPV